MDDRTVSHAAQVNTRSETLPVLEHMEDIQSQEQHLSYDLDSSLPSLLREQFANALVSLPDLTKHITVLGTKHFTRGARGEILKGKYKGEMVALKRMHARDDNRKSDRHLGRELTTWVRLNHENVLKLYGLCIVTIQDLEGIAMVAPWMEEGDAMTYIANHGKSACPRVLLDIANGLNYLHTEFGDSLVHGDLRANNVLVDGSHRAVLADFGLAGTVGRPDIPDADSKELHSITLGNDRWKAPELILPEQYDLTAWSCFTPAVDIYAFGMVIYELYTGQPPFSDVRGYNLLSSIINGLRPVRPGSELLAGGVSDTMWTIAEDCWKGDLKQRPTAMKLVERVAELVEGGSPQSTERQ
ncbi:kinase-like protein [Calocera viscosa TUFC12733]|uniref:Kinase-like protein n=1 Tax=Calocera viscosa (strain TUFC12733) TaxID=1330018 RepID=A0A167PQP8_CALVF|nr:kinase-like protein [Calocera viscosa TUFC12733]